IDSNSPGKNISNFNESFIIIYRLYLIPTFYHRNNFIGSKKRTIAEEPFRTEKAILYQMMDMPIVRIKSLDLKKNPFLDRDYFSKRKENHRMSRKLAYQKSIAAHSGYYAL
ncbi:MAG: hypothetical protein SPD93_00280, partial [Lachnospiraceae bacterium]|nr:hypothetical protein [Lachnospiraceae bacterium]